MGRQPCFISSHELFADACDETRFEKSLVGPLIQLRHAVGDGLFTAMPGEENWAIAHRTLIPAFGPLPIQSMFPGMLCARKRSVDVRFIPLNLMFDP